jgi:hypothetical protein
MICACCDRKATPAPVSAAILLCPKTGGVALLKVVS